MIIAVVADTHAKTEPITRALKLLKPDHLLFAGDHYADGQRMARSLSIPFNAVAGNCDAGNHRPQEDIVDIMGHKIFLVHGHQYRVKSSLNRIYYRAKELNADLAIFGHTHYPHLEKLEDIWLINPGSPSHPRAGQKGSYAVINMEKNSLVPSIIEL
jgi:putative phosphoesterase